MTIRELLEADWDVDKIDVTVREEETTKYMMRYLIGKDVKPGKYQRFQYETEAGDVYEENGKKTLYINRTIQFFQLEKKPQGKGMCRGILLKKIPKEILNLKIGHMSPCNCGWSHNLHRYRLCCYVNNWDGIQGENKANKEENYV